MFPEEIPGGLPPLKGIEHHVDLKSGAALPKRPAYRSNLQEMQEIQKQVGDNAYKLDLPGNPRISTTFNVADLTLCETGDTQSSSRASTFQGGGSDGEFEADLFQGDNTPLDAPHSSFGEPQGALESPQGPMEGSMTGGRSKQLNASMEIIVQATLTLKEDGRKEREIIVLEVYDPGKLKCVSGQQFHAQRRTLFLNKIFLVEISTTHPFQ